MKVRWLMLVSRSILIIPLWVFVLGWALLWPLAARAVDVCTASGTTTVSTVQINDSCILGDNTGDDGLVVDLGAQLGSTSSVFPVQVRPGFIANRIVNNGSILGKTSAGFTIRLSDNSDLTGGITNTGIISGATAIDVGIGARVSGGITNLAGGQITGEGRVISLLSAGSDISITNAGTISGNPGIHLTSSSSTLINTGSIISPSGEGIVLIAGSILSLNNTGTITTNDNTNPKAITVVQSVLNLSGNGAITVSPIALRNNSTLNLSGSNTYTGIEDDGSGSLNIVGDATSGGNYTGFGSITVNDGTTFNLGHSYSSSSTVFTIGQGTSGILNHTAGNIQLNNLTVAAGGTYTQSGTGTLTATSISIGTGGSVTLANQGVGSFNGAAAGQGALIFAGNYNTDAALGGINALNSITINDGVTLTLDQIAAANSLNIGGGASGALLLGGANLIDDNTAVTVNNGASFDLPGNNKTIGSLAGAGNLGAGGDNTSTSVSGIISGSGGLTKQGIGTMILSGTTNTYSGGTTVSGGILQGTTTSLQGNITNNATVTFDQTTTGTYADVISGTSSLIKSNTGTVILSGANTYSGGTTVSGGILQGTTDSLQGNITNNATVTFDQTTTGTYADVISGTGSLIKSNTGTVILSGANTYTGLTTISNGTLTLQGGAAIVDTGAVSITSGTLDIDAAETIGSLTGSGTVNLDAALTMGDANNTTYSGVIQGGNGLTKQGSGSVNLSGVNTYSGVTTINAGTLFVNGSIANSTTTVNAGGTLGGTGTVGTVNVSGGIFAPGNSIGTTNVTGNVDFSGGGIYQVEVDAAGNSDLINATGSATLTNGTVQVLPQAGTYAQSTDYTILTAAGGLGGDDL